MSRNKLACESCAANYFTRPMARLVVIFLSFAYTVSSHRHSCIHEALFPTHHQVKVARQQYSPDHPFQGAFESFNIDQPPIAEGNSSVRRRLDAAGRTNTGTGYDKDGWAPIRIKAYYQENLMSATTEQINFLKRDLIPAALGYWNKALQVHRVHGALKIPRFCTSNWRDGTCASTLSQEKCGHPSDPYAPSIPESHLAELEYCEYGPRSGCKRTNGGQGVPNADYVLYVTAFQTPHCGTENGETQTLAYAGKCMKDQWDRPIAGSANFCPKKLQEIASEWDGQLATAVHELGHALGFSSDNFAYFRFKNGTPRTPRATDGTPPITSGFECPGAAGTTSMRVPADNTLKFMSERGVKVTKVVTEKVQEVSRKFFNCDSLEGAELENQHTSTGACWGSHWEERLFETDLMSPVASHFTVYSELTLALFEDMGWYKPEYKYSQNALWGNKGGCKFAKGKCVENGVVSGPEFCLEGGKRGCTKDRLYCGFCGVTSWQTNLDPAYQYFRDDARKGGTLRQVDFCPYWQVYSNTDCRNPEFGPAEPDKNFYAESYGPSSRCVESTLRQSINYYSMPSGKETACHDLKCLSGTSLKIKVMKWNSRSNTAVGIWSEPCTKEGQVISVSGMQGQLLCPDPVPICKMRKCKHECSGRGKCLGEQCICAAGWTGEDCSEQECENDCSGHGTCGPDLICICDEGFIGRSCNTAQLHPTPAPPPVDCVLGNWSSFGVCEQGIQRRNRGVVVKASHGGQECAGLTQDMRECGDHCNTTEWTDFTECERTDVVDKDSGLVIQAGSRQRKRERISSTENDTEDIPCYLKDVVNCSVSCEVSTWSKWTGCKVPTKEDMMTRNRSITVEPRNMGMSCPALVQRKPCPHDCPGGKQWNRCGSECVRTCSDPKPVCTGECVAKCECPNNKPYWIPQTSIGATSDGPAGPRFLASSDGEGKCVARAECPKAWVYLAVSVSLTGMTYEKFDHKARNTFQKAVAGQIKVETEQVKLLRVKMIKEVRRRLQEAENGRKLDQKEDHTHAAKGPIAAKRRRLSGTVTPDHVSAGIIVDFTVQFDQVDSVSKDSNLKTAIASGVLLTKLQSSDDGVFADVDLQFVSSQVQETPPPAFNLEDAKELVMAVGRPMIEPIMMAIGAFAFVCCVLAGCAMLHNDNFDAKLQKLRQKKRVAGPSRREDGGLLKGEQAPPLRDFNQPMQPAFFTNPQAMSPGPGRGRPGNSDVGNEDNSIDVDMHLDEDIEANELDVDLGGMEEVNWEEITSAEGRDIGGTFSGKGPRQPRVGGGLSFYSKVPNKLKSKKGRRK